jgi:DNA-binding response OmpR family regulator
VQPLTILIATADKGRRDFLAHQLSADGHEVYLADSPQATTGKLATHAVDVLLLGDFERAGDAPALLRSLRAGQLHTRVHPAQPVVTIGDGGELATVRAYEAGSDHHVTSDSTYLVVRAVIAAVARRILSEVTSRHLHIGVLHIDTAARIAWVAGQRIELSRMEFNLLSELASDPTRLFSKAELLRAVWGHRDAPNVRTLDSHAYRLRSKLTSHGGEGFIASSHGHGYMLRCPD